MSDGRIRSWIAFSSDVCNKEIVAIPQAPLFTKEYRKNSELRNDIQDHWISFIVSNSDTFTRGQQGYEEITVFTDDRKVRLDSLKDAEWVDYKKKLDLLGQDLDAASAVQRKIRGSVLD